MAAAAEPGTGERVLAPLPAQDASGPAGNRERVQAQREARLRQLDEETAVQQRATVGGTVAGLQKILKKIDATAP